MPRATRASRSSRARPCAARGAGFASPASTSTAGSLACDLVLMSGGPRARGAPLLAVARPAHLERRGARFCSVVNRPSARTRRARAAACSASRPRSRTARPRALPRRARSGHPAPAMRFEVSGGERPPDAAGVAATKPAGSGAKAFVDFQNDVTARDLALASREGFRSIEHVKRYTTAGMATDQGKTSSLNVLGIVAGQLGKAVPDVGHTTFRMPYTPVSFGSLAGLARGALFDPVRTTPMHESAVRRGAVFEDVGQWKRARYFPRAGEDMHAAVARECRAVRSGAGVFDASTLGKIAVVRPRRRGIPEPALRQRLLRPRAGALALRDPAARRRLHLRRRRDRAPRAGPLPRDDDDRRRRARARDDGGLPPDGMDRPRGLAHLGHRAMGRHRRAGTARAAGAHAARAGHRPAARRVAAHGGGRRAHRGRAGTAVSRELHRRARLRDQRAGRPRPQRVGSRLRGGRRRRHHALRHRDDARAARGEGLHHRRPGHGRHGDAARRRPRLGHRPEEAGLRRQALARARLDAVARTAGSSSACARATPAPCSRRARRSSRRRDRRRR